MTPGDSKRLAPCWWGCGARAPGGPRAPCPQGAPQVGLTSRQEGSQPLRPNSGGPSHRLPAQEASPEPPRDHCPGRLLTGGRRADLCPGDGASPLLCFPGPECDPTATTPGAPRLDTCPALPDSSSATIPPRLAGSRSSPAAGLGRGRDGGLACACRRVCRMKPEGGWGPAWVCRAADQGAAQRETPPTGQAAHP